MIFDTSTQYSFFEVTYEREAVVSVEQLVCFIKLFLKSLFFLPLLSFVFFFLAVHVYLLSVSLCLLCIDLLQYALVCSSRRRKTVDGCRTGCSRYLLCASSGDFCWKANGASAATSPTCVTCFSLATGFRVSFVLESPHVAVFSEPFASVAHIE
jgi:hypothetical protein